MLLAVNSMLSGAMEVNMVSLVEEGTLSVDITNLDGSDLVCGYLFTAE